MFKKIKKIHMCMLFVFLSILSFTNIYAAGVPTTLGYQGKLTDSGGNPLGGGGTNYYFKFSIWDNATPGSGTKLWPSTSPSPVTLTVRQGNFSVDIGDDTYPDPLNYDFNINSKIYLQVEVSGDGITYETLAPRSTISSSAFSQVTNSVNGIADSSFGTTTPFLNTLISALSTNVNKAVMTIKGAVGQVANLFNVLDSSGNSLFTVTPSGNVGVGTSTPFDALTIFDNNKYITLGGLGCSTGYVGINFNSSPNCSNYSFLGDGLSTFFNANAGGAMYFRIANTTRALIDSSGNVGIGTVTPTSKLDISGTGGTNVTINNTTSGSAGICLDGNGGQCAGADYLYISQAYSGFTTINNAKADSSMTFQIGGVSKMAINASSASLGSNALYVNTNNNFVGIGTTAPSANLDVSSTTGGIIRSTFSNGSAIATASFFGTTQSLAYPRAKFMIDNGATSITNAGLFVQPGENGKDAFLGVQDADESYVGNKQMFMYINTSGNKAILTSTVDDSNSSSAPSLVLSPGDFSASGGGNLVLLPDAGKTSYFNGSLSIGTTTPLDKLQVFGDIRLGTTGSNGCIKDYGGTGILGTCSSDERLKTNILDLSDSMLDKLVNLKVITYNWNDTAKDINKVDTTITNYGLLAQNVEQFLPELVSVDSNGYKQVNYSRIPLYLLKAVQELAKKVNGFADRFQTKQLCVGNTCIDENQLKVLLQSQNITPTVITETPVTVTDIATTTSTTTTPAIDISTTTDSVSVAEPVIAEPVTTPAPEPVIETVITPEIISESTSPVE